MGRSKPSSARAKTAQTTKGVTHLQSLNVIRNMIRVSVSEICYLRNLFPEELFTERVYADMHVKCLSPSKEDDSKDATDALLITQWLEDGVFEALKKKYLSSVALCVYAISADHRPAHLLESYTYSIKHAPDGTQELSTSFTGASPLNCTPQHVKTQAIQLVRSLVSITNNLDPLPRNRLITMKVHFNENCPESWQPKHFEHSSTLYCDHDENTSLKLTVGRVATPHHLVSMEIETAEECVESLSQAKSTSVGSQIVDERDDVANEVTTDDETLTPAEACREEEFGTDSVNEPSPTTPSAASNPEEHDDLSPSKEDFVKFVVLSDRIDKQSIERRFPSCSSAQIVKWLHELKDGGVLRKTAQNNHFAVAVHDSDVFYGAINETHGKMKRQITSEGLELALGISPALSQAMLLRMEAEKLIRKTADPLSFNVHFSESNRALVRKAIQQVKEQESESCKVQTVEAAVTDPDEIVVDSCPDVYEFEPSAFVTPTAQSKRKAQDSASSQSSTSSQTTCSSRTSEQNADSRAAPPGGCAHVPIVQVKRALKKRKLAVKPIS